jgi:hypothetical protein
VGPAQIRPWLQGDRLDYPAEPDHHRQAHPRSHPEMSAQPERRQAAMATAKTYSFTLSLSGSDVLTDEHLDAVYEAGCDDALFGERDGAQYADFAARTCGWSIKPRPTRTAAQGCTASSGVRAGHMPRERRRFGGLQSPEAGSARRSRCPTLQPTRLSGPGPAHCRRTGGSTRRPRRPRTDWPPRCAEFSFDGH